MNQDFSGLIKYLDGKFEKIDDRFENLSGIFATKDDLKKAAENLATKDDLNNLLTSIDAYAKKADAFFQEMVMLAHKVDRMEKWIKQLAEKVGIKLEY